MILQYVAECPPSNEHNRIDMGKTYIVTASLAIHEMKAGRRAVSNIAHHSLRLGISAKQWLYVREESKNLHRSKEFAYCSMTSLYPSPAKVKLKRQTSLLPFPTIKEKYGNDCNRTTFGSV